MTTTDLTSTAHTAAEKFDTDERAAESAAREYLTQIEEIDGQKYDEDGLPQEAADFIIESIRQAQDSLTIDPLDRVAESAEQVASAEDVLAVARAERDTRILAAIDAGAPIRQIALAGQISRNSVYKIRDNRP